MTTNLVFRIGDITFGLFGENDREFVITRPFSAFSSTSNALIQLNIIDHPRPIQPSGAQIFNSGQTWRLYRDGNKWSFWVRSFNLDPCLVGNFSLDYHSGDIFISESSTYPGKFLFPLSFPLGELLMTSVLGTGYGIMLHSCGVINREGGMVFAGTSTAGKTTTAQLWNNLDGVRVINDDHTILRNMNGEYRVYGTPWHGEGGIALAEDAPLKKIFILKHASSNQAERLSPSRAAAALLVRTFAPFWSAEGMAFTLKFLDGLCQTVPCYELGFLPDQSAVKYVQNLSSDLIGLQ
jgi:hypothetical protein